MVNPFAAFFSWLQGLFYSKQIEIIIVGLQNAGKTSLVNVLTAGQFSEEMVPTVGFNMKKVKKGSVTIKLWDIGGQARFRSLWKRYCKGANAILFVVDSTDVSLLDTAKAELSALIETPELSGIPLLVLCNKNDLPDAMKPEDLIERLELSKVSGRECSIYSISCMNSTNIDITLDWLTKRA
ncbi:ARF/SAR superfamily [Cystobasidium minutum MCA 4210]|uniref:ARF/SAR superfamily n=1 Tax=Cystobasidium minutum MCA 4210 TaxID=1397322 RepID=UPI0034CD0D8F|eukprot:jgi/Rhomi1/111156/CE111155_3127